MILFLFLLSNFQNLSPFSVKQHLGSGGDNRIIGLKSQIAEQLGGQLLENSVRPVTVIQWERMGINTFGQHDWKRLTSKADMQVTHIKTSFRKSLHDSPAGENILYFWFLHFNTGGWVISQKDQVIRHWNKVHLSSHLNICVFNLCSLRDMRPMAEPEM